MNFRFLRRYSYKHECKNHLNNCGYSRVVMRDLAKVKIVGSIPTARSNVSNHPTGVLQVKA